MATIRTHIDLDEVAARDGFMVGTYTKDCLVAATRALIAVVEKEGLGRFEPDELTEPWASALAAVQPFLPEVPDTMPEGVTEVDPW